MNILVCIKQVPGTNKVKIDPATGVLKRGGVDSKMNPYDLYAIETALRIREKRGGTVSVLTMGPPQAKAVLYEAFAMGADEGALISDRRFGGADVLATSYTLAQGIRKFGRFDLILCGQQTTDGDTAQVGPEISEWLGLPCVCNVRRLVEIGGDSVVVEMEMFRDVEISRVGFPCLLTVAKDICEPRLPSYVKKQRTKDRPVRVFSLDDMQDRDETHYGLSGSPTQVQRIFPPVEEKQRELWQAPAPELVGRLADKLRALKLI